ncbi:hypothetical protein EG349_16165 [Chryseobacterium shandongense]|uniref:Uncharacterized protein n=1 Tax=Chryseobacterium shandongense TaxID=1493872 RepID=A0AAD0YFZ8_9FLAO|nr:hypothetical protein [Chryseobacterium shandongense]AZA88214.1 hypothetical protein EG349_16165 [Chryseobacterium shandongense]AZA96775.1 hypothetical protein EG353_14955 [Chryseobacterium shandongense]
MKNTTFKTLLLFISIATITGCTSDDDLIVQDTKTPTEKKELSKTKTYTIRYGLISQSGIKTLSGSYDVGSFVATNTISGDSFETYVGSGFQALPQYSEGIPAGTYIFTAMQGQGGWVGYGSVTGMVSEDQVDDDGYITIYIPIVWEE